MIEVVFSAMLIQAFSREPELECGYVVNDSSAVVAAQGSYQGPSFIRA